MPLLFDQGVLDYDDATVATLPMAPSVHMHSYGQNNNIEITPAQLALDPCTGSCVITDVKDRTAKGFSQLSGL